MTLVSKGEDSMQKVKITVEKRTVNEDLLEKYGSEKLGICNFHKEGQVYYCEDGWQKPEGLCDNAWKSMMEYVMTLAHGGRQFYDDEWLNEPNLAVVSCNDGIRPVIFKIEAIEE